MKIVKKYAPDSEIIKQVALGREKARYLTIYGLGDTFEEKTVRKMKSCDAFSVQIDESEVNRCLDLEKGDAETIKETLLEAFNDDEIDYRSNLFHVGMYG